jgi:hypothetical protein
MMMFPLGGGRFRPNPRRIRELKEIPGAAKEWDVPMQRQLDEAFEGEEDFFLRTVYGSEAQGQQWALAHRRVQAEEDMNALLREHSPYPKMGKDWIDPDMFKKRAITRKPGLVQFEAWKTRVGKTNRNVDAYGRKHGEETTKLPSFGDDVPEYGVKIDSKITRNEARQEFINSRIVPYSVPKKLRYKPDAPLKFDPRRRSGR